MKTSFLWVLFALTSSLTCFGITVNADFSRDTSAQNPGGNPAPVLYSGTGPLGDTGTVWNDLQVPMAASGDQGTDSVAHPVQFDNLVDSSGTATTIDVELTSGFFRSFNGSATPSADPTALQNDRVFPRNGDLATLTIQGLDPGKSYTLALINAASFITAYTVDSVSKVATGAAYSSAWEEGATHVIFSGISPSPTGEIVVGVQDGEAPVDSFGVIAGLQISEFGPPVRFLYADSVTSTGGEFNGSYPPSNLLNNGFTSPDDIIDTTTTYPAAGNNYASASPTPNAGVFDLIFEFPSATEIDGMHVWNYVFRSSGGGGSGTAGVNSYELTFYDGPGATGSEIGSVFSGNLDAAIFDAFNTAQSVSFPAAYAGVRSVKMHVLSNYGGSFTGMNELAFNGSTNSPPTAIDSFTTSAPFVQRPATPTLSWTVSGTVTSLEITPDLGDVLPLTTGGSGSIPVSPIGEQTYTLTLNGTITQEVSVIGLPEQEKLHLYLLIGQSNMQGQGQGYNASLDAPDPRVLKFGSRDGMEQSFVTGGHRLTSLATTPDVTIGMGVEFGKTLLASESDPEVVICLINHALGSTAIEWWEPGVTNGNNGTNLYDNAITRINNASSFGVLKGVLWHQGEYNANNNSNPASDPNGYAARLSALVDNLRTDFDNPSLPFVCGKFVPRDWDDGGTTDDFTGLPNRAIVEAALDDLPNQRTNTFSVDNIGLRGNASDRIHFDAASQRILGQRYAAAMNAFYADPYLLYLGGFLTPAEMAAPLLSGPNADFDNDGYANYLEFAFLTNLAQAENNPLIGSAVANVPGEGDFLTISFRQRSDSAAPDYLAEVSPDLDIWTSNLEGPAVTEVLGTPVDNGDGTATVTIRDLSPVTPAVPKRFLRIRVTGQ